MITLGTVVGVDARCLDVEAGEGSDDASALAQEVRRVASRAYALLRGPEGPSGPEDERARLRERVERLRRRIGRLGQDSGEAGPAGGLARWVEALRRRLDEPSGRDTTGRPADQPSSTNRSE